MKIVLRLVCAMLALAGIAPTIWVTSSSVSPAFFSPNGDGKNDKTTFSFQVSLATDKLYGECPEEEEEDCEEDDEEKHAVHQWRLDSKLTIGNVRTIATSTELPLPHPFVDDEIAARAATNDNGQIPLTSKGKSPLKNGTQFHLKDQETLTLPAGNYYFTRVEIEGKATLALAGKVVLWVAGKGKIAGDAKVNAGGNVGDLWIVQGGCGKKVEVEGDARIAAILYAPESRVKLAGKSRLTGAAVGRDVKVEGHAKVTYSQPGATPFADPERTKIGAALFARRSLRIGGHAVAEGKVASLGPIRLDGHALAQGDASAGGEISVKGNAAITGTKLSNIPSPISVAIVWDGMTDAGGAAPEGQYAATLEASLIRERRPCGATEFTSCTIASLPQPFALPQTATLDLTAPEISIVSPAPNSGSGTAQPTISVAYVDALSGIDPSSVKLLLDGTDVTAQSTVTASGVNFTPTQPLGPGTHSIELHVSDLAANESVATWSFFLDGTPPSVTLSPATGDLTIDITPTLTATYSDAQSGVNPASFQAKLDGVDVTTSFTVGGSQATFTPTLPLAEGPHLFLATIADNAGNVAQATSTFRIVSAAAMIGVGGGIVEVTDPARAAFGARMAVPSGAVPQTSVFSIEHVAAPPAFPTGFVSVGPVVDLNPSLVFNQPVTISIPYGDALVQGTGVPEKGLKLLRFDTSLGLWTLVPVAQIDTVKNLILAQVTQFVGVLFGVAAQIVDAGQSVVEASPNPLPADGVSVATLTVIPKDAAGFLLGPNQNVTLAIQGPGVVTPVQDLGNGTYRAFLTSDTPGTTWVKATVNGTLLSLQPAVAFVPAFPNYFELSGFAGSLPAGQVASLTIAAKLNSGSVMTSFVGTVEIHLTGTRDAAGALIFPESFFAIFAPANEGVLTLPNALVFARAGVQQVKVTLVTKPTVLGFAQIVVAPGPATILTKVAGDNQSGTVGSVLPQPLVVKLTDLFGNPIAGATVEYQAGAGGALFVTGAGAGAPAVITKLVGGLGDGGPATAAPLSPSYAIASGSGSLYISDTGHHVIRKVDSAGTISTIAGSGVPGYAGDGGEALKARFRSPSGLALDPAGNLYVADTGNHVVRRITAGGVITTVAGTGVPGVTPSSGVATLMPLDSPSTLAADPQGRVYISRPFEWTINRLNLNGTMERVVTSSMVQAWVQTDPFLWYFFYPTFGYLPFEVTSFTFADQLYILFSHMGWSGDQWSIVRPSDGFLQTVASGPTPPGVFFNYGLVVHPQKGFVVTPQPIALGPSGSILMFDSAVVRRVESTGISGGTVVGTGVVVAGNGHLSYGGDGGPAIHAAITGGDMAADAAGNLYVADVFNHRVRKVSPSGTIATIAGDGTAASTGDGGPASSARVRFPLALAMDSSENLYVAEGSPVGGGTSRVRKIAADGAISTLAGSEVTSSGSNFLDLAIAGDGNLYVAESGLHRVRRFSPSTGTVTVAAGTGAAGFSGDGGPANAARLNGPRGIAVDGAGNLWIADAGNQRLRRVSPDGVITTALAVPGIRAVTTGASGDLFFNEDVFTGVGAEKASLLKRRAPDGTVTTIAGNGQANGAGDGGEALSASLTGVAQLATDAPGDLLVMDTAVGADLARIRKVTLGGAGGFTTSATASAVTDANGLAVSPPILLPGAAGTTTIGAGAGGTASAQFTVIAVAPGEAPAAPVIASPSSGATVYSATPVVSGTAPVGLTVVLQANGLPIGTATAAGGAWSLTTSALTSGAHTLVAYAVSPGNVYSPGSTPVEITVSLAPPAPPVITTPSKKTNDKTPKIQGTAAPFATVVVFAGDQGVGAAFSDGSGHWTLEGTSVALADAVYAFTARSQSLPGVLSDPSDSVLIVIDTVPPDAPTHLAATPAQSRVFLTWDASQAGDTLGYHVWRKAEGDPDSAYAKLNAFPVVRTEYCDDAVQNGLPYCYKVTAVDNAVNEAGP